MPGTIAYSIGLNRGSGYFAINVDYYIEGYIDPETGEAFFETRWSASLYDVNSGNYGNNGGYGWDTGFGGIEIGFPPGEAVADITVTFNAVNGFSGETVDMSWHVLNAGYAIGDKTLTGLSIDDIIVSGSGQDLLSGLGGNDFLDGGDGNDELNGGDGADQLDGGGGWDRMLGGAGDDIYQVDNSLDAAVELAGGGNDMVFAYVSYTLGEHVEQLLLAGPGLLNGTGNAQNNQVYGNQDANVLSGLGGNDSLVGSGGNDALHGGAGHDVLDGGAGINRLLGGLGNDTYVVSSSGDQIVERAGEGSDTVRALASSYALSRNVENLVNISELASFHGIGNAAANVLTGGSQRDLLDGRAGNDLLDGGAGDDVLQGGGGADRFVGGLGFDYASYANATGAVSVSLATGLGTRGEAIGDSFASIEGLIGSAFADRLAGGAGADWLIGGAGSDLLQGGAGDGVSYAGSARPVTIDLHARTARGGDAQGDVLSRFDNAEGSAGRDVLLGSTAANLLIGGDGNDRLDGRAGNDTLRGGTGADILTGGAGIDGLSYVGSDAGVVVNLGTGAVSGGHAAGDRVSGMEDVEGSALADHLTGNGAGNSLRGGAGDDTLSGGGGNDTIIGDAGADAMDGGAGRDTLSYAGSEQWVSVFLYQSLAIGADGSGDGIAGFENLRGGEANDVLFGDAQANTIEGGFGDDYLAGYGGNDQLIGGSGDDSFYFGSAYVGEASVIEAHVLDFVAGGTDDRIYVQMGAGFDSFAEIMAAGQMVGDDAVFQLGSGWTLILEGVNTASLVSDDFVFLI